MYKTPKKLVKFKFSHKDDCVDMLLNYFEHYKHKLDPYMAVDELWQVCAFHNLSHPTVVDFSAHGRIEKVLRESKRIRSYHVVVTRARNLQGLLAQMPEEFRRDIGIMTYLSWVI